MKKIFDDFDKLDDVLPNMTNTQVFQIFPSVFGDNRGSFSEVLKHNDNTKQNYIDYSTTTNWIKQINRSKSTRLTVRGCHAQKGRFCQAKLVEAINEPIYDIITDARPESKTFGLTKAYLLDPMTQNKLFVPRGFLHAFAVPADIATNCAIFQYYCDNVYNKDSEFCVNPMSIIPDCIKSLNIQTTSIMMNSLKNMLDDIDQWNISDKDKNNQSFDEFKTKVMNDWNDNKSSWWR